MDCNATHCNIHFDTSKLIQQKFLAKAECGTFTTHLYTKEDGYFTLNVTENNTQSVCSEPLDIVLQKTPTDEPRKLDLIQYDTNNNKLSFNKSDLFTVKYPGCNGCS